MLHLQSNQKLMQHRRPRLPPLLLLLALPLPGAGCKPVYCGIGCVEVADAFFYGVNATLNCTARSGAIPTSDLYDAGLAGATSCGSVTSFVSNTPQICSVTSSSDFNPYEQPPVLCGNVTTAEQQQQLVRVCRVTLHTSEGWTKCVDAVTNKPTTQCKPSGVPDDDKGRSQSNGRKLRSFALAFAIATSVLAICAVVAGSVLLSVLLVTCCQDTGGTAPVAPVADRAIDTGGGVELQNAAAAPPRN